jgi:thiosulfate/3-mercaptopyruvate sulfurtransferase
MGWRIGRLVVWLACGVAAAAAQNRADLLVTNDWLAAHLKDPELVILHTGTAQDYDAGHIPGARLVTLSAISKTGDEGLRLELPPVETLENAFGSLGVSETPRVVIYAGNDTMQSATRVWFTLDYLGLSARVSLLQAPLSVWKQEGREVSRQAASAQAATLAARPRTRAVVSFGELKALLDARAVELIDARTPEFYSGAELGMMTRGGHIPGARNVPFLTLLDEQGRLKPLEAWRQSLAPGDGRPLVLYCHIGQQATLLYFAARMLGRDVRLYDGSFQDWSRRTELPVETAGHRE